MDVDALAGRLPQMFFDSAKRAGLATLTPPQELAVDAGLLEGRNFVIAAPTASGKTLIGEMAMLRAVGFQKKKAVYIAPMRALVSEKYSEFKSAYPSLRIAMSIGDLDSLDMWLAQYDIILASTEKMDSLIRHGAEWLGDIGCVVFDEVHMLDDAGRGPTLEILMTRMRRLSRSAQIIALSATVGNAREIAEWLDADLVESDYRPVLLEKGIVNDGVVHYEDKTEELGGSSKIPELRVIQDTLEKKKQLLLFYSTKRNAEAGAEKAKEIVEKYLTAEEKAGLSELATKVLNALDRPTAQCEKLARCIERGAAFHHSGLVNEQRALVEDSFRAGLLKSICATTTLGIGVNLPAHTVVVRDTSRYSEGEGAQRMGINEVTQLFGRAGRPKYDKHGRALLIAKSKSEISELYARYMAAGLEPVISKVGVLSTLRSHALGFISTGFLTSEESMLGFLGETLYGHQYSSMSDMRVILRDVLSELERWGFVERLGSRYAATKTGSRVSELYIDPLSARWILDSVLKSRDDVANLFMIANTVEMRPYVRIVEDAADAFPQYSYMLENTAVNYDSDDLVYYDPLKPLSTALMLNGWISEVNEHELVRAYSTTPGALFSKLSNADWMLYSAIELGKLAKASTRSLLELRIRMKYGISKELGDLVRLEGIGRVRARLLYGSGIKSVADMRREGAAAKVEKLLGKEISKKILEQVKSL
jgi:helicase